MKSKRCELKNELVKEYFENLGVPLYKSKIYLTEPFITKGISDPDGIYLPRFYEGYIYPNENIVEVEIHESSHGAFFENIPLGKQIAQLDKFIWEKEQDFFGKDAYEQKLVVFGKENQKLKENDDLPVFEVEEKEFKEYLNAADELESLIKNYLLFIEGFALYATEDLLNTKPKLPGKIYEEAYNSLKPLYQKMGFEGIIKKGFEK